MFQIAEHSEICKTYVFDPSCYIGIGVYIGLVYMGSSWQSEEMWDEITYPFPNFNGATVVFLELISHFIPHFMMGVITYPYCD